MVKIREHPKFDRIFVSGGNNDTKIYTKNLDPGNNVYGEQLVRFRGKEYREWNPYRSKLGAVISKKARNIYLMKNTKCLYLGAASGTTVSHISDIVSEGMCFAVEFAPRSLRELVQHCENRRNIIPILADANQPTKYSPFIYGKIDVIYEDIAQPTQTDIGIKNCKVYLKDGGIFIITVKARSIDVARKPSEIFNEQIEKLKENNFDVLDTVDIKPYTHDHLVIIARYFEN